MTPVPWYRFYAGMGSVIQLLRGSVEVTSWPSMPWAEYPPREVIDFKRKGPLPIELQPCAGYWGRRNPQHALWLARRKPPVRAPKLVSGGAVVLGRQDAYLAHSADGVVRPLADRGSLRPNYSMFVRQRHQMEDFGTWMSIAFKIQMSRDIKACPRMSEFVLRQHLRNMHGFL